jgi:DNA polymerase IV
MSNYNITGRPRVIMHVDMDAFFASIAQLDDPSLRGRPVLVGGHSLRRGVVSSASYEARAYGVCSAMPLYQALEKCPQAVVVPAAMARYREVNQALREIWGRYSPLVEVASFDEAYMDLTGCEPVIGPPVEAARAMQAEVLKETGVTCSVGLGTNKLVAKVASKRHKPRGLCVVPPGDEAAWLAPLRIGELHGVGPKTAARLAEVGLTHVHQLASVPADQLERFLGPLASHLVLMARGIDHRPVEPGAPAKSIGAETTFDRDVTDPERLKAVFYDLVQEVGFRLRRGGLFARTVTVKIRYHDFETVTRARTLPQATDDDQVLAEAALALWRQHAQPGRPVRLVGVSLSHLSGVAQLSLLAGPEHEERRQLNQTLDELRRRHGLWVVTRGTHLGRSRGA